MTFRREDDTKLEFGVPSTLVPWSLGSGITVPSRRPTRVAATPPATDGSGQLESADGIS